jgi:hypothetical protein
MTQTYGSTQSSSRLNFNLPSRFKYKYSNSNSKEYVAWYHMIRRCYYPKTAFYENYGGRGIIVCDRWLGAEGFDNFYQDMGVKPSSKLSLDRIDTNGNYSPENCRWATTKEQARNRRTNKRLLLDGEEKTLIEWCEKFSADFLLVKDRLRDGWDLVTALTTPKKRFLLQVGDKYNSWTIVSKVESSNKYNVQCKCDNMAKVSGFDLVNDKSTQCKSCAKLGNTYASK